MDGKNSHQLCGKNTSAWDSSVVLDFSLLDESYLVSISSNFTIYEQILELIDFWTMRLVEVYEICLYVLNLVNATHSFDALLCVDPFLLFQIN